MPKRKNQESWVVNQLLNYGEVSRNAALNNFISRLGAIMCDLKNQGWNFTAGSRKTGNRDDYVYILTDWPQPMKIEKIYVQGQEVAQRVIPQT